MKRSIILAGLIFPLLFLFSACGRSSSEEPEIASPSLPFTDPNILGIERINTRSLETVDDALVCLASGQPVYAITAANSNVRPGSATGECRVGRIPEGRLVRIDAAYETDADEPLVSTTVPLELEGGSSIAYVEDVQPIFERACVACHSGVVQMNELQVTEYEPLMAGGLTSPAVVPGNLDESLLWQRVDKNEMPMIGDLSDLDKETIRLWIQAGAPERRSGLPAPENLWLTVDKEFVDEVEESCDGGLDGAGLTMVNAELIQPLNCATEPSQEVVDAAVDAAASASEASGALVSTTAGGGGNVSGISATSAGIQAAAFGLSAPTDDDGWLELQGGFCIERRLPDNKRSVTAIDFAPDGRMFLALDSPPTGDADPLILYDAHHPSRSIAVYDYLSDSNFREIFDESTRITGLDYYNGALYITRAGEVGRIPDGGGYESLANGFAVQSQLFHANNGIVISNGYLYISAGGVTDGWSDGPIVGLSEAAAQSWAAGGNAFSARIVRAPLDRLLAERNINAFETAARGTRNPYGITVDPGGRIWFSDNGATNVPDGMWAGDEIDLLLPGAITGDEETSPHFGYPMALSETPPDWYEDPVVSLVNAASPTGITWAYNTVFFGQYGKDPGLFRLGRAANGQVVAERLMLAWPILAVTTAPDGAIWVGMGTGELFRITPGCEN